MALQKIWEKVNLPRGDVQLLKNSNASGVLRLTQSNYNIDQTVYFRHQIFAHLPWIPTQGKEMTKAAFELVIDCKNCGVFNLDISHKDSWESNQDNYTTGLHWGPALEYVQDESLIGKTLTLYAAQSGSFQFRIEIW
jgi:hypothetical protein